MSRPSWLDPELATLRFQGLRRDKDPADVMRELP